MTGRDENRGTRPCGCLSQARFRARDEVVRRVAAEVARPDWGGPMY